MNKTLSKFRAHIKQPIPFEFMKDQAVIMEERCELLIRLLRVERPFDLHKHIHDKLVDMIGQKPITIFAGGGLDSNYLLLRCISIFGHEKITVQCALTKSNREEVGNLKKLCIKEGVNINIYSPSENDIEYQVDRFQSKFSRLPNDVAQPLLNHLARESIDQDKSAIMLDGQYADTFMFSNPQNLYWRATNLLSCVNSLWAAKKIIKSNSKLWRFFAFSFFKPAYKIAFLCNIEIEREAISYIESLCSHYKGVLDNELIFQVFFSVVTLEYRESDKYLLYPDIVSPFKSNDLFFDACRNRVKYRGLWEKKIPLRRYINDHYPSYKGASRSRSFEGS